MREENTMWHWNTQFQSDGQDQQQEVAGRRFMLQCIITKPSQCKFTRINTLEKNSSARPMKC